MHRIRHLLVTGAVVALAGCFGSGRDGHVNATPSGFVDDSGRSLLLRGINARVRGLFDVSFDDGRTALEPIPAFTEDDCRFLAEALGFNLLRLPVNWSGIEPERGVYDDAYIARVLEVIRFCAPHGVYVLVDLHQDAWSKHIGEDGAPLWAIVPPPEQLLEGPLEDLAERRVSEQVVRAFESFFDNEEGLQDAYAAMAAVLATAIADEPNVVGLELMNEPVLFSREERLDAFHRKAAEAVRRVASALPVAFEPNSLRNFTDRAEIREPAPVDNAIYAPHVYTGVFTGDWEIGEEQRVTDSVFAAVDEARQAGAALLVGEFGEDARSERGRAWLSAAFAALDQVQASWALWVYEEWSQGSWGLYDAVTGPEPGRGALREDVADVVARAWPEAIDGGLVSFRYDAGTHVLRVTTAGNGRRHRVALPGRHFGATAELTCGDVTTIVAVTSGRADIDCRERSFSVRPVTSAQDS